MSIRPDDPKLSAWLLGELSAQEAAAVERAVAADPALAMAVREMESVQRLLANTLAPEVTSLFPRQRGSILQEARRLDAARPVVAIPARKPATPVSWFFPMAAAAVLALACWLLVQLPSDDRAQTADQATKPNPPAAKEPSLWPAPAPADSAPSAVAMPAAQTTDSQVKWPVIIPRRAVKAADQPVLPLPVQAGTRSLDWVTHAIRDEQRLPSIHAVRFEEIINRFPVRPAGMASVAQGVALAAETVSCPWRPSSLLVVISLRGASGGAREVTAEFRPQLSGVRAYRLCGYATAQGAKEVALPTSLAAGTTHTLVLELEPATPGASLGSIEWSVNGRSAPGLVLPHRRDKEPSDDARFAALVACCCEWWGGAASAVDREVLQGLVRELHAPNLPAGRADFLRLVEQALELPPR